MLLRCSCFVMTGPLSKFSYLHPNTYMQSYLRPSMSVAALRLPARRTLQAAHIIASQGPSTAHDAVDTPCNVPVQAVLSACSLTSRALACRDALRPITDVHDLCISNLVSIISLSLLEYSEPTNSMVFFLKSFPEFFGVWTYVV